MNTKLISIAIMAMSVFALSACNSTAEPKNKAKPVAKLKGPISKKPKVEVIYDVKLFPGKIQYSVSSNGCTKAKDFALDTKPAGKNMSSVTLLRLNPDYCRAMPRLIQITKPLPAAIAGKKQKIAIVNPFSTNLPGRHKVRADK